MSVVSRELRTYLISKFNENGYDYAEFSTLCIQGLIFNEL